MFLFNFSFNLFFFFNSASSLHYFITKFCFPLSSFKKKERKNQFFSFVFQTILSFHFINVDDDYIIMMMIIMIKMMMILLKVNYRLFLLHYNFTLLHCLIVIIIILFFSVFRCLLQKFNFISIASYMSV